MRKALVPSSRGVRGVVEDLHRWRVHRLLGFACALLLGLASLSCEGDDGERGPPGTPAPVPPGPGLQMTITSVRINLDSVPEVEFALADDTGKPLALADLDSSPRFILARIDVDPATGISKYQAYNVVSVAGKNFELDDVDTAPRLESAGQVAADSGGAFEDQGEGKFLYIFGKALPAGHDPNATHTLGAYATRESRRYVANPIRHFVPAGGPPPQSRELMKTETCGECHDPLEAHGGTRRELALCVLCHTDQTIDPETENSLEMGEMVHKIHAGEDLSKLPYYVVGFNQAVHDYSRVVFPQDLRNCTKCHADGAQADYWKSRPARRACGACHDDVNFATGENHSEGIIQADDTSCNVCHKDALAAEFDTSVPGAHVVPYSSSANPNLTLAITAVEDMTPGGKPRVTFTISDENGPVDIAALDRVRVVFAGPTADYSQLLATGTISIQGSGSTGTLTTNAVGDYSFAPDSYTIPTSAEGTWSVGMEARTLAVSVGGANVQFGANNPVAHIDLADGTLGGGAPQGRRKVVDEASCSNCHGDIVFHGNQRTEIPYCLVCHNTWATDETRRPGLDPATNPPESIDFKFMIHRIHTGEELENPYTVYGFGASENNFNEVLYPGDRRNCEACHEKGTQWLPVPSTNAATVVNIAGTPVPQADAVRTPSTAACTGCHDGDAAFTHARVNSVVSSPTDWEESCAVCHGEGKEFAASELHARGD